MTTEQLITGKDLVLETVEYWQGKLETAELTRSDRQIEYCERRLLEVEQELETIEYVESLLNGGGYAPSN
jgi:hypothetical protein